MGLAEALAEMAAMLEAGKINGYAVGGAVAAAFYIEPAETEDLDVFISVEGAGVDLLAGPYAFLMQRGGQPRGGHIEIHGVPLQLLGSDRLAEEGVARAHEMQVDDLRVSVLPPEYLAALALKVGRSKDLQRLRAFLEWEDFDRSSFEDLITRHSLADEWAKFARRFPEFVG